MVTVRNGCQELSEERSQCFGFRVFCELNFIAIRNYSIQNYVSSSVNTKLDTIRSSLRLLSLLESLYA